MTPDVHYAKGPEGYVAYQVTGGGPVDIVFVPDWVTNVEVMWEEAAIARFLARLGSIGRLICYDKRGTGISDPVPLGALPTLECELRGDDVSGIAVHIGARVAGAANTGEVLVSGTLKDLVTGSGLRFVERGVHRLKGVEGEWPLHAAE
jgi:pimeloyl-ACP methyl ester carboxylesterase